MATKEKERDIERTIIQWAESQEKIRAVLLTSTRAIHHADIDALSDYDVILIVQSIQPFMDDRTWINDFGDVLVVYWDPIHPDPIFAIDMIANVTQYDDGLKIDFTLWPVSLFEKITSASELLPELDAGYRVLLDKDHLTTRMRPTTHTAYVPKPPTITTYLTLINDFYSDAPYVAKCLWRDELLPAKWCLECDMKHNYLRQLLEWRMEMDHNWMLPTGFLGKGLKKRLPIDIWTQLEQTYVGSKLVDNWVALEKTMLLFRRVAIEVGGYFGYSYPHDLDKRVTAYVEHIKRLEPHSTQIRSNTKS